MTDQVDNWHKLARFDTNIQGELQANLLRNNDITVSLQALSAIPGMNSGVVLWVQETDLVEAQHILNSIDTDTDNELLLDSMSDADLGIVPETKISLVAGDNSDTMNNDTINNDTVNKGPINNDPMNKGGNL